MATAKQNAVKAAGIGNKIMPARFLLFLGVMIAAYFAQKLLMPADDWRDGAAIAFDVAAAVFLVSLFPLMRECSAADMRTHAAANDANRAIVLGLTTLLTVVAMAAITGELKGAQNGEWPAMAKLVGTLLLVWLFANSVYTLHYAHTFYSKDPKKGGDCGGIDFPGSDDTPSYWDFAYFAYTLGMTFQTSDVEISSTYVRKVALLHCFAAFVFNIGVIAFTINVLGGSS
jgi:uncharacterized membrane protein